MPNPWLNPGTKWISEDEKKRKDAAARKAAADALSKESYEPPKKKSGGGGFFGGLRSVAGDVGGVVGGAAEEVGGALKDAGGSVLGGLSTYGNQVQSVPAYLFTKGTVEDGRYTTRGKLGNPLANVRSHIRAQRKAGLIDENANPLIESFRAANRAGKAFGEDPDINAGVKFGTGIVFDPMSYSPAIAAKVLSKAPPIGRALANPGLGGRSLKAALSLTEGFDKPSTLAKFTLGGSAATALADKLNAPPLVEMAAGVAGGGLAGRVGKGRSGKHVPKMEVVGPRFESQRLNEMIEELGRFPSLEEYEEAIVEPLKREMDIHLAKRAEELKAQGFDMPGKSSTYTDDPIFKSLWERRGQLAFDKKDYDRIKALYDATSGNVRSASEIDAEIDRLTQEQLSIPKPPGANYAKGANVEQLTRDIKDLLDDPNMPPQAAAWFEIEKQIRELEKQKGGLRSVDTASDLAGVKAARNRTYVNLTDEDLIKNVRNWQISVDTLQASVDSGMATANDRAKLLERQAELADYSRAAQARGLDVSRPSETSSLSTVEPVIKPSRDVSAATENLSDTEREIVRRLRNGESLADIQASMQKPPVEPPAIPLRKLPDDELYAILKDKSHPQLAEAKMELQRRFQATTTRKPNAPRQKINIADIPELSTDELLRYASQENIGGWFKRAVEKELKSRDISAETVLGIPSKKPPIEPPPDSLDIPAGGVPPEGYVRLYRGLGNNPNDAVSSWSGHWFSPNRDLAQNYSGPNGIVSYVDVPREVAEGTQIGYSAGQPTRTHKETGLREEIFLPREWAELANPPSPYPIQNVNPSSIGQRPVPTPEQIKAREERIKGLSEGPPGGALSERLVDVQPIKPGLTPGEKVGNVFRKVERTVFPIKATLNNPISTPIVREARRINNVLINQSGRLNRQMKLAESVFDADESGFISSINGTSLPVPKTIGQFAIDRMHGRTYGVTLTDNQKNVLDSLSRTIDSIEYTRREFGLGDDLRIIDPSGYATGKLGSSQSTVEFMENFADKASRKVAQQAFEKTKLESAQRGLEVPPEVSDVINRYLKRNIGPGSDFERLVSNTNNALRSLWARADLSRVFIQDLPLLVDNPVLWAKHQKMVAKALKDPDYVAKIINRIDEERYGTGKPTSTDWARNHLELSGGSAKDYEKSGISILDKVPGVGRALKATERAFTDGGDLNRLAQANMMWDNLQFGIGPGKSVNGLHNISGLSRDEIMQRIAAAVNRSSGTASAPFAGDIGRATMFAPRFFQSQLESIVKAASDGGIEGQIARRQLGKMIGLGVTFTFVVNRSRGEETSFDPTDSNFLRIRNIGGHDVSVFGPWDSLVRGIVKATPTYDQDGDLNLGDPLYLPRTKLSPIMGTAVDLLTGSNAIGREVSLKDPLGVAQNLAVPFSFRDAVSIDKEGINLSKDPTQFLTGLVGLKASPLTEKEKLANQFENAGIRKSDPDYLIKRREWLAANPQEIPDDLRGAYRRSREISADILKRREANSELTISNKQSLEKFRDIRTKLLAEQRNRLDEVNEFSKKPHSTQERWLDSYFKLFDKAKDPTGEIDSSLLDPLIADWEEKNGTEALDFINRYMGTGLNEAEKAYYDDLQTLQKDGYFKMPKLRNMRSGLDEASILAARDRVIRARLEDPSLQARPFDAVAKQLLRDEFSGAELADIINAGKEAFKSRELIAYENSHRKELMWFNPRATWSTYQNAQNRTATSRGKLSGKSLKKALAR